MPSTYDGRLPNVPTFPVKDGTTGTLTNLKHASYINMFIEGASASAGLLLVSGMRELSVHETHDTASLEYFAGSRRPEVKKGSRRFTMTGTRAEFAQKPLKQLIRDAYGLPAKGSDIYLLDYPVRATIKYQQMNADFTACINEEDELYDELWFNDLTVQHITSENGFVTEQFTAMGAYQIITTSSGVGYTIQTRPYADAFALTGGQSSGSSGGEASSAARAAASNASIPSIGAAVQNVFQNFTGSLT